MNELIIADKIEKSLQEKREPIIFPLDLNHRKELRALRDTNIGNLKDKLNNIERLKREEYIKKHALQIEKELKKYQTKADVLNSDWEVRVLKIKNIIKERKEFEKKIDTNRLILYNDYDAVGELKLLEYKRKFSFNSSSQSKEVAREEFDKKYKYKFEAVRKKIDVLVTHYEEAINFGDLEIVKKLYYLMKKSDNFFNKINELEI